MVERLWLQPEDVANFDHSVPVYLGKYGCFFYVSKLSNFTPGKLTEKPLNLIPLPGGGKPPVLVDNRFSPFT